MLSSRNMARSNDVLAVKRSIILSSDPTTPRGFTASPKHIPHRRSFSWGGRNKWRTNGQGKASFEQIKKEMIGRTGVRYPDIERRIFLHRYLPVSGWRSASHWKYSPGSWPVKDEKDQNSSTRKQEDFDEDDWYTRWEQRKKRQFEEFMAKIDRDPFAAIFGQSNRWLGWAGETIARGAAAPNVPPSDLKTEAEKYIKSKEDLTQKEAHEKKTQSQSILTENATEAGENEYDIDPITLRKVPKKTYLSGGPDKAQINDDSKTFEIPVKAFKSSSVSQRKPKEDVSSTPAERVSSGPKKDVPIKPVEDWLAREGFKFAPDSREPTAQDGYGTTITAKAPAPKIESALDRHLQVKSGEADKTEPKLQYEPKENKQEDVDLLRASDVRASAGIRGRPAQEDGNVRAFRRQALEDKYERQQAYLQGEMRRELRYLKERERQKQHAIGEVAPFTRELKNTIEDAEFNKKKPTLDSVHRTLRSNIETAVAISEADKTGRLSAFTNEKALQMQAKLVPLKEQIDMMKAEYDALRKRWLEETRRLRAKKAAKLHAEEVSAQKTAMESLELRSSKTIAADTPKVAETPELLRGEGDMAANVADFCSRDRWYKRKAPHARDQMDMKMQQLVKDKAFVREIRGIYEETYGVIDTKHRQVQVDDQKEAKTDKGFTLLKEDPSPELVKDASTSTVKSARQQSTPHQNLPSPQPSSGLDQHTVRLIHEIANHLRGSSSVPTTASRTQTPKESKQAETPAMGVQLTGVKAKEPLLGGQPAHLAGGINDTTPNQITTYRILAYDPTTHTVHSTKSTSSSSSGTPFFAGEQQQPSLTPLQALNSLNNLGKFLPQLMRFHGMGYEIVGGAPNVVVLRKVGGLKDDVDDDAGGEGKVFVRREEEVFSGRQGKGQQQHGKKQHRRGGGKVRAMLATGVATAAMCYAVGVVSEIAKAGGI